MSLILSIDVVLLLNLVFLNVNCQSECLQTNNTSGLPQFRGYPAPPGERIHHQNQAIIPTYKFNCCGNITEWGVDLNPSEHSGRFSFDFQVWRPSPTVTDDGSGCYSLVSNYAVRSISIDTKVTSDHVARVTPSVQLQFQQGDVLGFYVESHGTGNMDDNNGVVLLVSASYTSELVWHASVTDRSSMSGSCPYSVGTNGVLNSPSRAAPVISISTSVYSCPSSFTKTIIPTSTFNQENTLVSSLMIESVTMTESIVLTESIHVSTVHVRTLDPGVIAGAVVACLVVCITLLTLIISIVIAVMKKRRVGGKATGQEFVKQVQGGNQRSQGVPGHLSRQFPGQNKHYSKFAYPSAAVEMAFVKKETQRVPQQLAPIDNVCYLMVDTSEQNHIYDYQYAEASCVGVGEAAQNPHDQAYEVPNKKLFIETGVYVPTADERSCWESHYETCNESGTNVYNKTKFFIEEQIYWAPAKTANDIYSQLASKKYREIPRDQIRTTQALGSGEFGEVHKALWSISGATKEVAVKTLKPGSSEKDQVRFLQEAAIMGQFNHPNVVKLYGVVTVKDPIMICIELMSRGDLRGYLVSLHPLHKQPTIGEIMSQQLKFSKQIASGMAYLSRKAFVHRDLAARNVLLDDSLNCKISDFGMARDLADDTYYTVQSKGNKIPVKWTAPEALLYKKYSPDSDVWSYGMVLFEIWSSGRKPFSNMTNQQVLKKIDSGYCQPPPPGCPRAIYKIMVDCWNPIHSQRPSFSELYSSLKAPKHTLLEWNEVAEPNRLQQAGHEVYQDLQYSYTCSKNNFCSLVPE